MIPHVIEREGKQEKVYDLYSRLLKDRIIFIGTTFTSELANSVVAQLLFLEADDPDKDVIMYINSHGGSADALIAIIDTMNYIKSDISTVCFGSASSAAACLLAMGTPGKRFALGNSRIMLHQVSTAAQGHISDIEISVREAQHVNDLMISEIARITGKTKNKVKKDLDRDYYMSADEAKKYGLIDEVLVNRNV